MRLIRRTGGRPDIITDRRPRWPTMVAWSIRRKWRTLSKLIWQRTPRRPPKRRITVATMRDIPRTGIAEITWNIRARITDHRRRSVTMDEWWIRRKWPTPRPRIWPPTPRRPPRSLICHTTILTRMPSGESFAEIRCKRDKVHSQ